MAETKKKTKTSKKAATKAPAKKTANKKQLRAEAKEKIFALGKNGVIKLRVALQDLRSPAGGAEGASRPQAGGRLKKKSKSYSGW